MNKSRRSQFDSVDHTKDSSDFVRYLDVTRATDFFQQVKQKILAMMDLHEGESVADIGCGTGEDVRVLAAQVGVGGRAVGIDLSSIMIETARQRLGEHKAGIDFVQADAQNLIFPDASFDAIRAERLLQHVPDAAAALREMVRVTKPGGRIVIWEGDLDLFVIDSLDHEASRIMQRFICDSFRNDAIGHELYRRFLELLLVDVRSTPLVNHFTDLALIENAFDLADSLERAIERKLLERDRASVWLESLRAASSAGQFSTAVGGFVVFGRKSWALTGVPKLVAGMYPKTEKIFLLGILTRRGFRPTLANGVFQQP